MRIEPPPSVPRCSAPMPSTAEATAPADEPPVVMRVSQGLRVMPVSGLSLVAFQPYSGMAVLPRTTAPCSLRRATAGASIFCGASGVSLRAEARGHAGDEDVVLHAHRHAVDEALRAAGHPARLRLLRRGQRAVGIEMAVGVDDRVEPLDARQRRLAPPRRARASWRDRAQRARWRRGGRGRSEWHHRCSLAVIPAERHAESRDPVLAPWVPDISLREIRDDNYTTVL